MTHPWCVPLCDLECTCVWVCVRVCVKQCIKCALKSQGRVCLRGAQTPASSRYVYRVLARGILSTSCALPSTSAPKLKHVLSFYCTHSHCHSPNLSFYHIPQSSQLTRSPQLLSSKVPVQFCVRKGVRNLYKKQQDDPLLSTNWQVEVRDVVW